MLRRWRRASTSALASASENVIPLNEAVGTATRQPNHMLLSGAPMRIVASPPPFGRFDTDGTAAPAACGLPSLGNAGCIVAAAIVQTKIAAETRVLM